MQREIILLLVGGGIGFVSSIGTVIVTNWLNKMGKVRLYAKMVYSRIPGWKSWGFYQTDGDIIFQIPLWLEIQNTSKKTRVIRDVNIDLVSQGKFITSMMQSNEIKLGENIDLFGTEDAYSFVAEPLCIKKYKCQFIIKKSEIKGNPEFNEIRLSYFNERDQKKSYQLRYIKDCWKPGPLDLDTGWKLLPCKSV